MELNKLINQVIEGNCIEVMESMPPNSVDLVVTSPPYNVGIDYDTHDDNMSENEYWKFTTSWINALYRVVKVGGRVCINIPMMGNSPSVAKSAGYLFHLPHYMDIIKSKFALRDCIIWIKSYAEYNENVFCGNNTAWGSWLSPSNPFCRSFSEFIIVLHKDSPQLQHDGISDLTKDEFLKWTKNVWFFPSKPNINHPATFPDELPYRCIKLYSYIDDVVLDPMCGSGTTLRVARRLKRRFIGIDVSPSYVDNVESDLSQRLMTSF